MNQFTVIEGQHNRRPDIVVFVNGLPLAVIELKNAADEDATIWDAWKQLQTYKQEIPSLFHYNERAGRLGWAASPHRVADGQPGMVQGLADDRRAKTTPPTSMLELEVLVRGVFDQRAVPEPAPAFHRLRGGHGQRPADKIMAGYHQIHAVNAAVVETVRAAAWRKLAVGRRTVALLGGRMHGGNR